MWSSSNPSPSFCIYNTHVEESFKHFAFNPVVLTALLWFCLCEGPSQGAIETFKGNNRQCNNSLVVLTVNLTVLNVYP